jgi:hypothetical protein
MSTKRQNQIAVVKVNPQIAKAQRAYAKAQAAASEQFDQAEAQASAQLEAETEAARFRYRTARRAAVVASNQMTDQAQRDNALIDVSKVAFVYSGKAGKCTCGCSGKYTYASAYAEAEGKRRGYAISPDEIGDRSIRTIVKKVNAAMLDPDAYGATDLDIDADGAEIIILDRLYLIKFVSTRKPSKPVRK